MCVCVCYCHLDLPWAILKQKGNAEHPAFAWYIQESIYSAEKDVQQMNSRVQREQEDLQRRAAVLADTALKQEAEAQRLQHERHSWRDGQAERSQLEAAARESKQQAQHLKVCLLLPPVEQLPCSC